MLSSLADLSPFSKYSESRSELDGLLACLKLSAVCRCGVLEHEYESESESQRQRPRTLECDGLVVLGAQHARLVHVDAVLVLVGQHVTGLGIKVARRERIVQNRHRLVGRHSFAGIVHEGE